MNNDPKVYVVNRGAHDFSEASRYGRLVFMTEGFQPRFGVNAAYRRFVFCMQNSTPDDWLLLTGLSTLNAIASAVFATKHGRLNLLLFTGKGYVKRTILIGEKDDRDPTERDEAPRD